LDAPAPYKTAAICNLISGGLNLLFGLAWIWLCIGIIPMAIGGWQIMVGMKMNNGEKDDNAKNSLIAGIVGGFLSFNIFSIAAAGYGFMQMGQDEVVGWIEG
jgi:hypothetical protein